MSEEKLDFTRKGIGKIYEKIMNGEITEEDMHEAAANTEAILRAKGVDTKVRFMGAYMPQVRVIDISTPEKQTKLDHFKETDDEPT